ncbi:MAG: YkgJ family cysteine cluster protein [Desulfovibrio sp.]|nr:MAG: YkgJ family cysteine cluster protein [Desulfovibrio sp.]
METPGAKDGAEDFLKSLPEIKPGESFRFACHPDVACFNACCADLNLMLTPYDVLRLRRALDMPSQEFIETHAQVSAYPDTGYPAMHLKMNEAAALACPFVTEQGCSVYGHRPGACRTYPVGRAAKLDHEGNLVEQFFLVREDHCKGFEDNQEWTTDSWRLDQDITRYNQANDRYMKLLFRQKGNGLISPKHANMCLLAVYQLDRFQEFIRHMNLFSRLELNEATQAAVLDNEEACLDFAMEWIELVIYGDNARLAPRRS